jgi:hypothetical protein
VFETEAILLLLLFTDGVLTSNTIPFYGERQDSYPKRTDVRSSGPILHIVTCYRLDTMFGQVIEVTDTIYKKLKKLRGLSPRANYTDRATAACRRS